MNKIQDFIGERKVEIRHIVVSICLIFSVYLTNFLLQDLSQLQDLSRLKQVTIPDFWGAIGILIAFFSTIFVLISYFKQSLEKRDLKLPIARWYLWIALFLATIYSFYSFYHFYKPPKQKAILILVIATLYLSLLIFQSLIISRTSKQSKPYIYVGYITIILTIIMGLWTWYTTQFVYIQILVAMWAILFFELVREIFLLDINSLASQRGDYREFELEKLFTNINKLGIWLNLSIMLSFLLFIVAISQFDNKISIGSSIKVEIDPVDLGFIKDIADSFFNSLVDIQSLLLAMVILVGTILLERQENLDKDVGQRVKGRLMRFLILYLILIVISIIGLLLYPLITLKSDHQLLVLVALLCFEFSFITILPSFIYLSGLISDFLEINPDEKDQHNSKVKQNNNEVNQSNNEANQSNNVTYITEKGNREKHIEKNTSFRKDFILSTLLVIFLLILGIKKQKST